MAEIIFTQDVNRKLKDILQSYIPKDIFVLTDNHSKDLCLPFFDKELILTNHFIEIEPGETHKSISSLEKVWNILSTQGAKRSSVLINIGGGMVTDLGGFAASCFKRGIHCINIPTTLLSQVDASVGGKTGVNFLGLKNEIGTFSIPDYVLIDTCFLKTLPRRQILSGFAEMLKHALLKGGEHLKAVMKFTPETISSTEFMQMLEESVEVKKKIVAEDPKEHGIRKALNFGHTVGHAIESYAIEKGIELYHGEAVAYGMIAELHLAVKKKGFNNEIYHQISQFINTLYTPYTSVTDGETLYKLMLHDKKNDNRGVNFTLLEAPGRISIDNYCSREEIIDTLQEIHFTI